MPDEFYTSKSQYVIVNDGKIEDIEEQIKEVLENNERNIEDEVDIKMKIKLLCEKMKDILKDRERTILELRFGLRWKET